MYGMSILETRWKHAHNAPSSSTNCRPIAVTADNSSWQQDYGSVVSTCDTTHVVVAVGYDEASFKVRNSSGSIWVRAFGLCKAACGLVNAYVVYSTRLPHLHRRIRGVRLCGASLCSPAYGTGRLYSIRGHTCSDVEALLSCVFGAFP